MGRVRTIAACVLLLIAFAAAMTSYFRTAALAIRCGGTWTVQALSHRGQVVVSCHGFALPRWIDADLRQTALADGMLAQMTRLARDKAGVGNVRRVYGGMGLAIHGAGTTTNANQFYALYLPGWLLTLVVAIPLLRRVFRWRQRAIRRADRQCEACGYDVRHSPDRCPECGHPIPGVVVQGAA